MFNPWPLGIAYIMAMVYVKRLSSNNYQVQVALSHTFDGRSPSKMLCISALKDNISQAMVRTANPDLVCNNDGEEKLLIRCEYSKKDIKKLGFLIMKPKDYIVRYCHSIQTSSIIFDDNKVVITPKPGLFPAKTTGQ